MSIVSSRRSWTVATLCVASLVAAAALVGCGGGSSASSTGAAPSAADPTKVALAGNDPSNPIQILSSEPSLVSGGNALVQVALPAGTPASGVKVLAAGSDETSRFQEVKPGTLLGVVQGLPVGTSSIDVVPTSGSGTVATVNVRNWPIEGPIITGPHQTPFFCQTQQFMLPDGSTLGPALDANCTVATHVTYMYGPTGGGALKVLPSTTALPVDVATVTTNAGVTVPFVVRVETGTVDRGIYQNAVLFNPTTE
jgi:hypothetical protein